MRGHFGRSHSGTTWFSGATYDEPNSSLLASTQVLHNVPSSVYAPPRHRRLTARGHRQTGFYRLAETFRCCRQQPTNDCRDRITRRAEPSVWPVRESGVSPHESPQTGSCESIPRWPGTVPDRPRGESDCRRRPRSNLGLVAHPTSPRSHFGDPEQRKRVRPVRSRTASEAQMAAKHIGCRGRRKRELRLRYART